MIGGGGAISGSSESAGLNTTAPTGDFGDGWLAEGKTTATSDPRKVDTYAICGPNSTFAWSNGASPLDQVGQTNEAIPMSGTCNPGETAYGGIEGNGGDVRIVTAHPMDEGWYSYVHNRALLPASATIWYACTDVYETKQRTASPVKVKGHKSGKAVAKCKGGEAVVHGGLETTSGGADARHTWASATRPWDSKDRKKVPDDGWLVKIYNYNSGGKVKMTATALCANL